MLDKDEDYSRFFNTDFSYDRRIIAGVGEIKKAIKNLSQEDLSRLLKELMEEGIV